MSLLSSKPASEVDNNPEGHAKQPFAWREFALRSHWRKRKTRTRSHKVTLSPDDFAKLAPKREAYEKANSDIFEADQWEKTVTLDMLVDEGCTIDDISHVIYDKMCAVEYESGICALDFFPHVSLDKIGGLDNVQKLWYPTRPLWALLLVGQCIANIALLLSLNKSIFAAAWMQAVRSAEEVTRHADNLDFSGAIRGMDVGHMSNSTSFDVAGDDGRFLTFAAEWEARRRFLAIASFIALMEVAGVLYLIWRVCQLLIRFSFSGSLGAKKSEFSAYMAIDTLVRTTIPLMSTFSALKLGVRVHPLIIYNDYTNTIRVTTLCGRPVGRGPLGVALLTIAFGISRLFYLTIGLSAFCVKCAVVGAKLTHPQLCSWWRSWAEAFALLNCCINAVPMEKQLQDRVFLFIFGGEDADYQDDERALLYVYRCWLIKAIWQEYWQKGERWKTFFLLTTLDHYDLQTMILQHSDKTILASCYPDVERGVPPSRIDEDDGMAEAMTSFAATATSGNPCAVEAEGLASVEADVEV